MRLRILYLSLTNKLFLFFLLIGLGGVLIANVFSFNNTRNALLDRTYKQLTSVRVLKKRQIEIFFKDRINEISYLAALSQTKKIFEKPLKNQSHNDFNDYDLFIKNSNYFENLFVSNFKECLLFTKDTDVFHFICNDSCTKDSKTKTLRKLQTKILDKKNTVIEDFQINNEGLHNNKLYIGTPVFINNIICGMIVLNLTSEAINNIMLIQDNRSGLGESGESYLVGEDYYMRSSSRFKDESFLNVKVNTVAISEALNHKENTKIINDYRGVKVISSYSKLNLPFLNWVILAEMDFKEVMISIALARKKYIFISIIICLFILPISYLLSSNITHPIIKLNHAINQVSEGSFNIFIRNSSHDEIGSLTKSFNLMAERLAQQTKEVKEREERLQHFYDATKDAIILHNNYIPMLLNQTACNLTGYTENELMRINIDSFLVLKNDPTAKSPFKNTVYETKLVKKDQTLLDVEVQENAIEYKNNYIKAIVIRDISRRKKAEKAFLEEKEKRLSSLIDGQEIERQRLSRELHDSLGQSLIAIKLKLESAIDADFEKTRNIVDSVKLHFDNTIEEVRRISNNLMPAVLYEFGIVTALSNLCKRVEETVNFEVRFYTNLTGDNYDNKIKTYIYRISQEALNNCVKHSKASLVKVYLLESTGNIKLIIKDNGKGFNFDENLANSGNGLLNMKERAQLMDAKFQLKTSSGQGTEIIIEIPTKYHE